MSEDTREGEAMSLDQLLSVQALDTTLEQLRHRRASLPERDELVAVAAERADIESRSADLRTSYDELARDQRRLEDEVSGIETRSIQASNKLYDGSVTSPKEAQAFQEEIEALKRHQSSIEDRIIELMEQVEPMRDSLATYEAAVNALDGREEAARSSLATKEGELDAEIALAEEQRVAAAEQLDPDVLARYEAIRAGFGASAVVTFDGKNCSGCPLSMPAVEADRVKKAAPGSLIDCTECGRLVVR